MKPEPTALYPTDECIIDGFSEGYAMCQLARDESFGWPLHDPDLDTQDPFNYRFGLDFDTSSMFDSAATDGCSKDWNVKTEPLAVVPEAAWQQLAININSPTRQRRPSTTTDSTSLTPALAALELPKELVPELEYTALECRRNDYSQKMEESPLQPQLEAYPNHVDYSQDLGEYPRPGVYTQGGQYLTGCGEGMGSYCSGEAITIGVYTRSERAAKLFRYRQKRARRNFAKRVLYGCRKRFADSRPRVGGRFIINENRVIKPKMFLKRGRPRKVIPLINYLAASYILN